MIIIKYIFIFEKFNIIKNYLKGLNFFNYNYINLSNLLLINAIILFIKKIFFK